MKVIKAGILDSIQDLGRYGNQHLGINPGGAMDKYIVQVVNAIVGNKLNEAVIEMHFPAAVFMFTQTAMIALGGADFAPTINGETIPDLHPIIVHKNDILQFHKPIKGARVYLAVAGGVSVNKWMQSSSTNLKAKTGGFNGRKLQKDDHLLLRLAFPYTLSKNETTILPWQADLHWHQDVTKEKKGDNIFNIIPGHEWDRLTNEAKENLTFKSFEISKNSDRMGFRINNIPLTTNSDEEVISSAVSFGTIQLLPDGKLIILMADLQTTGGYPRIAHIISAHHSKLGQLKPDDQIQFKLTDQLQAEELYLEQQQHLLLLQNACTFRLKEYFN